MRRTIEDQKQELIEGLTSARSRLIETIRALPAGCSGVVFLGVWSIKDLLAHLIGWDETNLQAVREILDGHAPGFFDYYDKDWQTYNHVLVERCRKDSLKDLLADVEASHQRFIVYLTP